MIFLQALWSRIWPFIAAVGGFVAAYFYGRVQGAGKEKDKQLKDNAEALTKAREIERETDQLTEDELRNRAVSRGWVRDPKR